MRSLLRAEVLKAKEESARNYQETYLRGGEWARERRMND